METIYRIAKKFWNHYKDKEENTGTPRKLSLETLIRRAENRVPVKPFCPICYVTDGLRQQMQFRASNIAIISGPIRDDQVWKCTRCFHVIQIGVPITREEALEEIDLRGHNRLLRPTIRTDERDDEIIIERLRKLGYIED